MARKISVIISSLVGPEQHVALVAVLDAQHLLAVIVIAAGFAPQVGGLDRRHQQFDRAGAVLLLAHDLARSSSTRAGRAAARRRCRRLPGGSCRRAASADARRSPPLWAFPRGWAGNSGTGAWAAGSDTRGPANGAARRTARGALMARTGVKASGSAKLPRAEPGDGRRSADIDHDFVIGIVVTNAIAHVKPVAGPSASGLRARLASLRSSSSMSQRGKSPMNAKTAFTAAALAGSLAARPRHRRQGRPGPGPARRRQVLRRRARRQERLRRRRRHQLRGHLDRRLRRPCLEIRRQGHLRGHDDPEGPRLARPRCKVDPSDYGPPPLRGEGFFVARRAARGLRPQRRAV